jgi:hypothetical protein
VEAVRKVDASSLAAGKLKDRLSKANSLAAMFDVLEAAMVGALLPFSVSLPNVAP